MRSNLLLAACLLSACATVHKSQSRVESSSTQVSTHSDGATYNRETTTTTEANGITYTDSVTALIRGVLPVDTIGFIQSVQVGTLHLNVAVTPLPGIDGRKDPSRGYAVTAVAKKDQEAIKTPIKITTNVKESGEEHTNDSVVTVQKSDVNTTTKESHRFNGWGAVAAAIAILFICAGIFIYFKTK